MASQGYRVKTPPADPKKVSKGHRLCLWVDVEEFQKLKAKLAMKGKKGISVSEWIRLRIQEEILNG